MSLPLISVIIPVYKVEQYLDYCVLSVRNQTYKNLEIILVDDGSPDSCPQMCDKYAELDKRIRVIHKANGGVSSARNAGLDICKGEYISFVDSDDYVHPRFIEILFRNIRQYNADISQCAYRMVPVNKKADNYKKIKEISKNVYTITGKEAAYNIISRDILRYCIVCNKLFSGRILQNIRFPVGMVNAEDLCVCYQCFFATDKVVISDFKLYFYYNRRDSVMHVRDDLSKNTIKALNGYEDYCKSYIHDNFEMQKYLEASFITKMDAVMEDYWHAYRSKDSKRMSETETLYRDMRVNARKMRYALRFKFKLFDIHPMLFIIARKMYAIISYL